MEHNKFRVVITGRYKKQIDQGIAAECIGEHCEITPTQALVLIQSRNSQVILESVEHKKAYQIKRTLEDNGVEIKLEPAKTYYGQTKEVEESKNKPTVLKRFVNLFKEKPKIEQQVDINWEDKPRYNRSTIIYSNKIKLPIGLILKAALVLFVIWYFWLKAITTDLLGDGFDEYGDPIVLVFTSKSCLQDCSQVLGNLRSRKVVFEHYIINPRLKNDEKYKLWKKHAKGKFPLVIAGKNTLTDSTKLGILALLGTTFGEKYLTTTEKELFKKHFHENGKPKIAIYCQSNNGVCQQLNKKLKVANLKFSYIEVDKLDNKTAVKEILDLTQYPVIFKGYKKTQGTDVSGITLMFE